MLKEIFEFQNIINNLKFFNYAFDLKVLKATNLRFFLFI